VSSGRKKTFFAAADSLKHKLLIFLASTVVVVVIIAQMGGLLTSNRLKLTSKTNFRKYFPNEAPSKACTVCNGKAGQVTLV
jgi:hypothetical protein